MVAASLRSGAATIVLQMPLRQYPQTKVPLCIVHLVRAALRYLSTADSKAVAADLKKIYGAATALEAEQTLMSFAQAWGEKYPTIAKTWRAK